MIGLSKNQSYYLLIALLLVFAILTGLLFFGFLAPIIIGALLAALGSRWYKKLLALLNDRKSLAAFIVVSVMILLIVIPLIASVVLLAKEAFSLFVFAREEININETIAAIQAVFSKINLKIDVAGLTENQLLPAIQNLGLYISQQLGGFLSNAISLVIVLLIIFITAFYFLKDGHRLGKFLIEVSPLKTADELFIAKTFKDVGGALFYGNFLIALIEGIFGGLGFWIFGLGSPFLWGLIIAILGIIPLLGASLVYIPAVIYLFIIDKPAIALVFLVYNIIYVMIFENILKPKLIGDQMRVHPLLVLLSLLGGLKVFGILGVVYGPLIITIFIGLLNIHREIQKGEVLVQ